MILGSWALSCAWGTGIRSPTALGSEWYLHFPLKLALEEVVGVDYIGLGGEWLEDTKWKSRKTTTNRVLLPSGLCWVHGHLGLLQRLSQELTGESGCLP